MKNLTHRFKVHQQSTWFKLLLPTYLVLISLLLLTNDTFAQITQVGTATTANNSGTTITITNPAGIQVGDVLLANIVQDDNSGGTDLDVNVTSPGWTSIDDGIASVWTPYELYFENKFSHCGVNSFQLIQVQGEWKISMITDTRRKVGCISESKQTMLIDSLVNQWHHAAAIADEDSFFGRMTPGCIYIGTDPTERWLRDELKEWSKEFFNRETAWAFKPLSRNITIGPGGQIAWFDELLDTWMGTCRSTGIMERIDGEWMIIYYHLSVALPNDKLDGYRILIEKK